MKKRKYGTWICMGSMLAVLATAIAGCGSANGATKYEAAAEAPMAAGGTWDGGIYESAAVDTAAQYDMEEEYAEEPSAETVKDQNRKLIKNVDMNVETREFDLLIRNVEKRVEELGGYVESSSIYNGSYTSNYRSRNADITARIPAGKLDQFITELAEQSNVIRKNESVEDVTLQYVDLESHKKALLAEQESLLSMLEKAESIEDIIAINGQLTDVRYRLESMESQLRTFDNKINYSTLYLSVEEVEQYEPVVQQSAWERIQTGFVRNLHRVGDGITDFCIEFVIALPVIVTMAVILGIFALILFVIIRAADKRAKKNREKMLQNPGQYNRYGMRVPAGQRKTGYPGAERSHAGMPGREPQQEHAAGTEGRNTSENTQESEHKDGE